MSDHRVMSQYRSFAIILGGAGAKTPDLIRYRRVVLMQFCSLWFYGAQNRVSRNCE